MLGLGWAKSTRSEGGNCLEARWQKSTKSDQLECLEARWQKSSAKCDSGACVEARCDQGTVQVRDTKDKGNGPILTFEAHAWQNFIDVIRRT